MTKNNKKYTGFVKKNYKPSPDPSLSERLSFSYFCYMTDND